MTDELRTDIALNENWNVSKDGTEDLKTVTGKDRIAQSVALNVRSEVRNIVGSQVTGTTINELEQAIRNGFRKDDDVENITRISIDKVDKQNNTVEWSAQVDGENVHGIT